MKRLILVSVILSILLAGSALGFDGDRKGFVLGGGLGIAPMAKWSVELGSDDYDEENTGLALHILIGGAIDEKNMIVYEGNATAYTTDILDKTAAQSFNGAVWYHYFGNTGKSAFTAVGLGFYSFKVEDFDANDPGLGILLGGGYEFSKHWQFGAYLSFGKTTEASVFDYKHSQISLLISTVAF